MPQSRVFVPEKGLKPVLSQSSSAVVRMVRTKLPSLASSFCHLQTASIPNDDEDEENWGGPRDSLHSYTKLPAVERRIA
jgi:hypothetical protein